MTKGKQEKVKDHQKKMQKALKNAPIVLQSDSVDNLQQLDWNDDRQLKQAREKLYSRLSKDERMEAYQWVHRWHHLVGESE